MHINENKKTFIGVDVSKDFLDLWDSKLSKHNRFENNTKGIKRLVAYLARFKDPHVVMEATGKYHVKLFKALCNEKVLVSISNPYRIRKFADAMGILSKTDKIDAQVITAFAQTMTPAPTPLPDEELRTLRELHAFREKLVDIRKSLRQEHFEHESQLVSQLVQKQLEDLDLEIKALEKAMKELIHRVPTLIAN